MSINQKFIFFILAFFLSSTASATVVVHSLQEQVEGWHTSVKFDYADSSAKVKKTDYDLSFRLSHNNAERQWLMFGNAAFGEVNKTENENNKLIHLRYIHKHVLSNFNFEGYVQHETDDFSLLASRNLVGGGLSMLTKGDVRSWHSLISIMHESEEHLTDPAQDSQMERFSLSSQLTWKFENNAKFTGVLYYQPSVNDMGDYRSTFNSDIEFPLNESFDLKVGYSWRYDSDPFVGVPAVKRELKTGIQYRF